MDNIKIHFTENPKDIDKYHQIRNKIYRQELNIALDHSKEDAPSGNKRILIIKLDDKVIGGLRVVFSESHNKSLPLEQTNLDIKKLFPEYDLDTHKFCEVGRICILPEHRNIKIISAVFRYMVSCSKDQCEYMFALAMYSHCRLYRKILKMLGQELLIQKEVPVEMEDTYQALSDPLVLLSMKVDLDKTPHKNIKN